MNQVDVLVVGAGPVGALTAALMAQAGLKVQVIEAGDPQILSAPASDGRAIAVALSAKRSLEVAGFWTHLANQDVVHARLVVAADGRKSPTREAAGLKISGWDYGQSAIVCAVSHDHPHDGVAYEHFMAAGPFALLPMTGQRTGIVWTEKRSLVDAILRQEDAAFLGELAEKIGNRLGRIQLAGPRFAYPLTFQMAERFINPRLALVGDAAHGMHPIAGQGLNIGIRDAAALAQVVVEGARLGMDVGSIPVLTRYQRWRRFDTTLMMGVTDGLVHLFSNRNPLLALGRNLGLWAVEHCPPAKRLFTRHAMGVVGDLPRPLQGLAI